ncbi:tetrapyrrole methylase family protein [human gut metagenome]|uniref:Tetrapyrrole methylase family protein n=1 Tax=human gut metagenome TaxID=408170 RepID=K1T049_9ZZZZ
MTPRVVETLQTVDVIAAEDTRNSIKLLNHFDIHTPMTSYHEYNKVKKDAPAGRTAAEWTEYCTGH